MTADIDLETLSRSHFELQAVLAARNAELRAARAEVEELRAALAALYADFARMPDAGLTDEDPRRAWWFSTWDSRENAARVVSRSSQSTPVGEGT